jgi:hypothetical protein
MNGCRSCGRDRRLIESGVCLRSDLKVVWCGAACEWGFVGRVDAAEVYTCVVDEAWLR